MSLEKLKEEYENSHCSDDLSSFEVYESGEWEVDGKYQHRTDYVKSKETGKIYSISESRSGSPFSDYYYSPTYIQEVKMEEKVVVQKCYHSVGDTVTVDMD